MTTVPQKCGGCRKTVFSRKEHCEGKNCSWWRCILCNSVNELGTDKYFRD